MRNAIKVYAFLKRSDSARASKLSDSGNEFEDEGTQYEKKQAIGESPFFKLWLQIIFRWEYLPVE